MRPINEIIIHATATRPDWWKSKSTGQKVAEVRKWHVEGNGWADIGYHYLIDRNGTVAEGRPLDRIGAHAKGRNTGTIGIALFGGHGGSETDCFDDHYTVAQDDALRDLIGTLQGRFGKLKISGHNEYAAKACPCFKVSDWLNHKTPRTSPVKSTTLQAAAGTAVAGAGGVFTALAKLDPVAQVAVLAFGAVALIGLGWISRERLRRWARGDR